MRSVFSELYRIRNLREEKSKRTLSEALARVSSCEQALAQTSSELRSFIATMPERIEAEYRQLELEATRPKGNASNNISNAVVTGVPLHRVQSFRAFELDLYIQRDALRVAQLERQQALKLAHETLASSRVAYSHAQRGRLKIEELQSAERKRAVREEERMEEKQLEEFKPRSIFAQLQ